MTDQLKQLSEAIYARDLDGAGSMHICSKEDPGAVEFIPASEARAQVAVAYEVAADAVLHKSDEMLATNRTWVGDRPYVCEESAYRRIKDLAPDHTTTALEQIKQQARDEEREAMNHVTETLKEAVHSYNQWMLDDDYNAGPVLDRTISHIKSALATLSADTQD
jgi:hypothetical protein